MRCEWKFSKIGDLGKIITGKTPPTKNQDLWNGNIPFITPRDLQNGKTALCTERTISRNGIKVMQSLKLPPKSVCVSCIGNIGYVAMTCSECISNQQINSIIVNSNNDADFVYYLMKSLHSTFKNYEGQSTTLSILNKKHFSDIDICIPPLDIQKKIAAILSALDEKIATNRAINDNLQQQAFSVFDNFIANAENNDCTVSDYAFLNPKRTLAKNQVARSIDMSQLSTSGAFPSGWEMKPFNGGMRFTNGDTLLARITPCLENGKTAFIDFLDDGEVAFGSTEYIVLAPKNDTPPEMLYCLARYPAFVDYAVKNMNGSSGRQRVSAETVGQYRLPLFDSHSLSLFKEIVSPMFLKMRYNSLENMRLAELRDALLPKLMSGEIDVSAVQPLAAKLSFL